MWRHTVESLRFVGMSGDGLLTTDERHAGCRRDRDTSGAGHHGPSFVVFAGIRCIERQLAPSFQ
jgi:hypothetical protein